MTTGKVTRVSTDPNAMLVQPPGDPAPAPVAFTGLTLAQLDVAKAAYIKGSDVDVEGTPPACGGILAR